VQRRHGALAYLKYLIIVTRAVLDYQTTRNVQSKIAMEVIHMTRFKLEAFTNDIIRKYRNGQSASSLGREYGASTTTVTNMLKNVGAMPSFGRGEHNAVPKQEADQIIDLFNSGSRPTDLMSRFNRSKSTIFAILRKGGVALRGIDGWTPTREMMLKKAAAKQANAIMNESEQFVYDSIIGAGFDCIPQFAFNTKNMDFAIPSLSVAVEVLCSSAILDGTPTA